MKQKPNKIKRSLFGGYNKISVERNIDKLESKYQELLDEECDKYEKLLQEKNKELESLLKKK